MENKESFMIIESVDRIDLYFCFRGNGKEVRIDLKGGTIKSNHKLTQKEKSYVCQNII